MGRKVLRMDYCAASFDLFMEFVGNYKKTPAFLPVIYAVWWAPVGIKLQTSSVLSSTQALTPNQTNVRAPFVWAR